MRRIKRHTVGLAKTKQRLEKGASLSSVEMTERRLTAMRFNKAIQVIKENNLVEDFEERCRNK